MEFGELITDKLTQWTDGIRQPVYTCLWCTLTYETNDPSVRAKLVAGIFLPFWSQGQGPVEFGKTFGSSELGKLDAV